MAVLNKIHPGLVLLFCEQQLALNEAWVNIHQDRFYEDVRFPSRPTFPLGMVRSMPAGVLLWTGKREYIGKMNTRVHIYSVRQYPNGAGTWFDFAESFHALREALTGVSCVPVMFEGEQVGIVYSSRFLSEMKYVDQEDDVETLYHGIAIEVVHK